MVLLHSSFPTRLFSITISTLPCHSHIHTHRNRPEGGRLNTAQRPIPNSCPPRFPLHPTANGIVPYHKYPQLCNSLDSAAQGSSTQCIVVHVMLTYPRHSVPPTSPVQLPLANTIDQQNIPKTIRETTYRIQQRNSSVDVIGVTGDGNQSLLGICGSTARDGCTRVGHTDLAG